MLRPAWYLSDTEWFSLLDDAPQLDDDRQAIIDDLSRVLPNGATSPALTVAATFLLVTSADYLGDTMSWAAKSIDLAELPRLLCGLNLAQAHLTQMIQRMAAHTAARAFRGSAEVPADVLRAITDSLSVAGANSELVAAHLKEANLRLHGVTQ
ncbi:hypothetical protein COUCH_11325 [Couchioplanes caeruleus]|uniref:hypothetical protein n=1 Tax=Couchioplanes caeruleus TaxID=56438 RepID=UPI0020C15E01|nr:hypothetical protein [Couchioplanes caeruleus]UQU66814.1 hypothetical protein COUCH_11325 [Couchioplanes caeruleus]